MTVHMTPVRPRRACARRKPEPTHAVRGAEQTWRHAGGHLDGLLRQRYFAVNEFGRFEIEARVRLGMIADFVALRTDLAGDPPAGAGRFFRT